MAPMLPGEQAQRGDRGCLHRGPRERHRVVLPGDPERELVVPMRRRGVARDACGEHADRPVEVRQVVDRSPRRDHRGRVPVDPVEPALHHRLLVAADLVDGGREERSQTGDRAERVDQLDPVQRPPSPRGRIRTQALPELGERVGERRVEHVVVEPSGRIAQQRRQDLALEDLAIHVVAAEQLLAQPRLQRPARDVSRPHVEHARGDGRRGHVAVPPVRAARSRRARRRSSVRARAATGAPRARGSTAVSDWIRAIEATS